MAKQQAPGKFYRKGITLVEAIQRFSDEDEAEAWFISTRWPDGVVCPFCDEMTGVQERKNRKPQPWRCKSCRKDFSVKTNTLMHGSKLSLGTWAIAYFLFSTNLKGVSSMKLRRDLGITQKTAWHLAHRIRETLNDSDDPDVHLFTGPVETDETYVGGKERNKHASKKQHAGRGTVGKTPVVGMKDRTTGRVSTAVIEHADRPTLHSFVQSHTQAPATVYTDDATAYQGMHRPHESVGHGRGEYVRNEVHTNGIESHWAMFKRGIYGTYHHISEKHTDRYAAEFSGRHNVRPFDTSEQMAAMVTGGDGKRLRYIDLIGPEETRINGGRHG
jgi:transposase-like protein